MHEPWNKNQKRNRVNHIPAVNLRHNFLSALQFILRHFSTVSNCISIGNSMIRSDIWPKYHESYFKIVVRNFKSRYASEIWDNFEISQVLFMPNITYKSCYHCYTTTSKRFVIFTCRYFKLSWNTTALSQSNCRNFSCSSITAIQNKSQQKWTTEVTCLMMRNVAISYPDEAAMI